MRNGLRHHVARFGIFQHSAAWLLGSIGVLFVASPFIDHIPGGDLIEAAALSLVMFAAVLVVGARHRTLLVAIGLAVPSLVAKWVNHARPELVTSEYFLIPAIVFVGFVVVRMVIGIVRAPRVDSEVLCAGISAYLLIAILWCLGYILVARVVPNSFVFAVVPHGPDATMVGFKALYFSLITLSTVGYGDITPSSDPSRMLAMSEAMIGVFYMTILIARLVALYPNHRTESVDDR